MARTPKPIVSSTGGTPRGGQTPRGLNRGIDRFLAIQRPVVLAHLRSIRRRNQNATPAELATILERRYVAAVTTGGAAVGVTAVVPSIGTGVTLALSGVETAGFLEATALYAQSLSELHGIAVDDPDRARALVLTMMLGHEGSDLVRQLAGQVSGSGPSRSAYWGELIASSLPRAVVGPLVDRLKATFLRQFAVRGGASIVARAIPFGIGAIVGGAGNNMLGRRVVQNSRLAFGPAPETYVRALDLPPLVVRTRPSALTAAGGGLRKVGDATGGGLRKVGDAAGGGLRKVGDAASGAAARAGRMAGRALPRRKPEPRPEPAPEA